jgi:hypothetical protein
MKVTWKKKYTKTNISTYIAKKKRRVIQTTYVYLTGTNKEKEKYLTSLGFFFSFDANEQE